jgi:hypothetical protein
MAGRPGRGGQNRIAPDAHVLRGTFKPSRHAARIGAGPVWDPAAVLAALDVPGRAFLERLCAGYTLSLIEGEVAVQAAQALDRLAEIRARRAKASAKARAALDRQELAWGRALNGCLLALRTARPAVEAPVSKWKSAV